MIVTKEQQEAILDKYIKEKHNTDECSGFIDGVNAAIELINNIMLRDKQGNNVSDADIDDLLNDIDDKALDYFDREYGLPLHGYMLKELREVVRSWMKKQNIQL